LGDKKTGENKRKALEALDSRGSRHGAATAAGVSLKTLMEWRRCDTQFRGGMGRDDRPGDEAAAGTAA